MSIRRALSLFCVLTLAACGTQGGSIPPYGAAPDQSATAAPASVTMPSGMSYVSPGGAQPQQAQMLSAPVKVAILLPLSGQNAAVGEALLQAAQLAVFDMNETNFQLVPRDTKGTREGAAAAVDEAARDGAQLILGPLFAQEVDGARQSARRYGLNVIGFSTDWRTAGESVYTMGVLPQQQAARMADFAARQGLRNVALLTPSDAYGDTVASAFAQEAQRHGLMIGAKVRVLSNGQNAAAAVSQLAATGRVDGVFMPLSGASLQAVLAAMNVQGLGCSRVRCMGTGIWDGTDAVQNAGLANAWYAAPSPQIRADFERKYQQTYGANPPRLASLGYDAAALAIVLARSAAAHGQKISFDRAALTNPNGFAGVDGIFRFNRNGLIERGMAVLQISNGTASVVDPAPVSFQ